MAAFAATTQVCRPVLQIHILADDGKVVSTTNVNFLSRVRRQPTLDAGPSRAENEGGIDDMYTTR